MCNNLVIEDKALADRPCPIQISYDELKQFLKSFSLSISSRSRMSFWKKIGNSHKWTASPEEHGKQLLIQALSAKYDKVLIVQEHNVGAGI